LSEAIFSFPAAYFSGVVGGDALIGERTGIRGTYGCFLADAQSEFNFCGDRHQIKHIPFLVATLGCDLTSARVEMPSQGVAGLSGLEGIFSFPGLVVMLGAFSRTAEVSLALVARSKNFANGLPWVISINILTVTTCGCRM